MALRRRLRCFDGLIHRLPSRRLNVSCCQLVGLMMNNVVKFQIPERAKVRLASTPRS